MYSIEAYGVVYIYDEGDGERIYYIGGVLLRRVGWLIAYKSCVYSVI